jgi:hypothetical protein
MKKELKSDYRIRLAALGFSPVEIDAIEFVLLRMGVFIPGCEHEQPKFVECYPLDDDETINEQRWQKGMRETGFRADAIGLAEHGLGVCRLDCELCATKGTT